VNRRSSDSKWKGRKGRESGVSLVGRGNVKVDQAAEIGAARDCSGNWNWTFVSLSSPPSIFGLKRQLSRTFGQVNESRLPHAYQLCFNRATAEQFSPLSLSLSTRIKNVLLRNIEQSLKTVIDVELHSNSQTISFVFCLLLHLLPRPFAFRLAINRPSKRRHFSFHSYALLSELCSRFYGL
jgi:hypothetical protein